MAKQNIGVDLPFRADADLSSYQFKGVKMSSSQDYISLVDGATDVPIGILQDKPAAAGAECTVRILGSSKVFAGESLAVGNQIGFDATAEATVLSPGTDTTKYIVGVVVQAATTDGDIAEVILYGPHRAS